MGNTVEIYPDRAGNFRWRTRDSGNHKIIATSNQSFASSYDAQRAAERANAVQFVEIHKRHIASVVMPGRALGRHVEHDPRSKLYRLEPKAASIADVDWPLRIPRLNQGSVGKCTAETAGEILGSDPYVSTLRFAPQSLNDSWTDGFYSDEENLDGDGPFPPNDNGSSGLTSAKVAKARGLISGYLHTFTAADALKGLAQYPAAWGTNWKSGMDNVNTTTGQVRYTGSTRGGHELSLFKIVADKEQLWFHNHWGAWGYQNSGDAWISFADFEASLADEGDVTFYVPTSEPAPTPVPVPTPANPDLALVAAGDAWEPSIFSKITKAGRFKSTFDAWKQEKGY